MKQLKQINPKYEIQYFEADEYKTIYLNFFPIKNVKVALNRVSVTLILFDGFSRIAFNQQFVNTQQYLLSLTDRFYVYDMLRYHTVGYNSKPNYVPLFYGQSCKNISKV